MNKEKQLIKEIYSIGMQTTQNFEMGHKRIMLLLNKYYEGKKMKEKTYYFLLGVWFTLGIILLGVLIKLIML